MDRRVMLVPLDPRDPLEPLDPRVLLVYLDLKVLVVLRDLLVLLVSLVLPAEWDPLVLMVTPVVQDLLALPAKMDPRA